MTAAPSDILAAPQPAARRGLWVPLACFYLSLLVAHLHLASIAIPSTYAVAAAMSLGLLVLPVEYTIGALGGAFLAASSGDVGQLFLTMRWIFLGAGAVILSLRFFLRRRAGQAAPSKFAYLLALFLVASMSTVMTTTAPGLTVLKLGAVLCLFYVAWRAVGYLVENYGPAAPRRLIIGLLAYALGFMLVAAPSYLAYSGTYSHFSGYLGNPNTWAALLATTLPWMAGPLLSRSRRQQSLGRRRLQALGLFVGSYLLLRAGSRAALVGALLAFAVTCLIHANRRMAIMVVLASVYITARLLASPQLLPILVERYLYKQNSQQAQTDLLQSRLRPWQTARDNFRDNLWLGLGFGVTSKREAAWSADVRSSYSSETGSSIWGSLSQIGIVGAAPLFLALALLLFEAGRFAWKVRDPWFTGIYGSVLALSVNAIFEGWLLSPGNFISTYFWVQCFFVNALMSRFRPARARSASLSMPLADSLGPPDKRWAHGGV
ncbi:MAG TPA: O-antigen ligase family protein [Bryobacterales bacterium]|nr:O-antigen ligase family protein [Bryobacterales bacterium]